MAAAAAITPFEEDTGGRSKRSRSMIEGDYCSPAMSNKRPREGDDHPRWRQQEGDVEMGEAQGQGQLREEPRPATPDGGGSTGSDAVSPPRTPVKRQRSEITGVKAAGGAVDGEGGGEGDGGGNAGGGGRPAAVGDGEGGVVAGEGGAAGSGGGSTPPSGGDRGRSSGDIVVHPHAIKA